MKLIGWCFFISFSSALAFATPSAVILIRHGEKPLSGPELSPRGWERAKALPQIFSRPEFSKYGLPVCLIGMTNKKVDGSIRSLQTLHYLSEQFRVRLNDSFNRDDDQQMVRYVMKSSECHGGLVVIAWEHNVLEDIATEFGVTPKPKWPGVIFDRIWLLEFSNSAVQFKNLPQNLLPGDSKN